ncbi:putative L-type lectin-domain containing receptor kinase S.5 [Apium graveolens]|uniref:putative L-type lectin-domain containing receptor kinase S.5 n=1 Tax=Apium graveolens TaxID=4045 RepID=UPI003D7A6EEC
MKKVYNLSNIFLLASVVFLACFVFEAQSLHFNYPDFPTEVVHEFVREGSEFSQKAIQVTPDDNGAEMKDKSGRIWYHKPLKLWSKNKSVTASFNTTFQLNINPNFGTLSETETRWGHGMAFILSGDRSIPSNSYGKWLGIVNETTNGFDSNNIVAVEFDTNESDDSKDVDDNHVGIDVNSIYSLVQEPLSPHGVNLSSGDNVTATLRYDGKSKELVIFVYMTNTLVDERNSTPIISRFLNLSDHLPQRVYVGFSASTGQYAELNCVTSWSFSSTNIDDDDLLWVLWVVIPIVLLVLVVISVLFCKWRKRIEANNRENYMVEQQIQSSATAPVKFQLKDLKRATGNFDSMNELGRGGFGVVYKGILSNKEVAVKRLNNSGDSKQEFMAEVTIIGNLHHKNLVKLVGWCHEDNELLVVYEFMPNGSLDKMIFRNSDTSLPRLSWEKRHVIICGVAQALDYLHNGCENRVLHRDIKASNIMLDSEFNPRLGDFGLARTVIRNGKTHHSTEIAGTPGYMAPESFLIGKATVEMDVYAFGVVILEIACERKPGVQIEENNYGNRIVERVWLLHKRDCLIDAIDNEANISIDQEQQVECVLKLGLACCHPNPYERPSMRTVLQVLKGEAYPPPIPRERPVFMWPASPPFLNEIMEESLAAGQLSPITILTSGR